MYTYESLYQDLKAMKPSDRTAEPVRFASNTGVHSVSKLHRIADAAELSNPLVLEGAV